jgi:hypothetical protein
MYCIVERVVLAPLGEEERTALLEQAALLSVYEIMEAVPDPRKRHGLRYEVAFLLTCLVAALLCQCNSTEAVAQWCREHGALLRQVFGARLFLTPSGSLYRKLLPRLDAATLEEVLGRWIQATLQAAPDEPIALDGKTHVGNILTKLQLAHRTQAAIYAIKQGFITLDEIQIPFRQNEVP